VGTIINNKTRSLISKIKSLNSHYIFDQDEERTPEIAHFYFLGKYKGEETVYDAFLYTLRLHHSSELYEIAESKAMQQYPDFKKLSSEDSIGDVDNMDSVDEEIGLYMAEIILELEEEEAVKVQEHVDMDTLIETGIGLDVGLNVEEITDNVISKFINDFNNGEIDLDKTLYSFQSGSEF
jgi:hypothetical protein